MPLPRWVPKLNKRVFNRMELKKGARPALVHVGRSSSTTYRTPLDAHRVEGGNIFILMYGSPSDWLQNILTAGTATLEIGGEEHVLVAPQGDRQRNRPPAPATHDEGTSGVPQRHRVTTDGAQFLITLARQPGRLSDTVKRRRWRMSCVFRC